MPVQDVVSGGPGLAFITFPEALSQLPLPQLWAVMFFFMLYLLGLDSEFALIETVLTSLYDMVSIILSILIIIIIAIIIIIIIIIETVRTSLYDMVSGRTAGPTLTDKPTDRLTETVTGRLTQPAG